MPRKPYNISDWGGNYESFSPHETYKKFVLEWNIGEANDLHTVSFLSAISLVNLSAVRLMILSAVRLVDLSAVSLVI